MSKRSNAKMTAALVVSVSFMIAAVVAILLAFYYRLVCFKMLGNFCKEIITKYPDSGQYLLQLLKTQDFYSASGDEKFLSAFGYHPSNLQIADTAVFWIAGFAFLAGGSLFLFCFWYSRKKTDARIRALTNTLEKINTGGQGLLLDASEDEFSRLQDEIYKTVTTLYQTRDAALAAKKSFADNLANIAHQLKTPVTSISLCVQMAGEGDENSPIRGIGRQLDRLTRLEEALLLLSRIDAGTLVLNRKPTDVFTLLTLAADNLYELFLQKGVSIEIPEMGEMAITADPDWTMEAVINLMKNCLEASEGGKTVYCACEQNPLYVQIRIWDEGPGFEKEDLPHLFERFYRGKANRGAGIGIGLSLAKAIIEMQNGVIRALNLPEGSACFEIRFYSH